jgi:hypothetical protein
MARVKAFSIPGMNLWFWSNDHEPPHFHAKRDGKWEVRVNFLLAKEQMIEVKWSCAPISAKDRKLLQENSEAFRMELFQEWSDIN